MYAYKYMSAFEKQIYQIPIRECDPHFNIIMRNSWNIMNNICIKPVEIWMGIYENQTSSKKYITSVTSKALEEIPTELSRRTIGLNGPATWRKYFG